MATKKTQPVYDESSVKHLNYKESVQQKMGMYIGGNDAHALWTICRETLDNIVDEALNGHATHAEFYLGPNGDYITIDDGRGMPIGNIVIKDNVSGAQHKIPSIVAITSLLHAGGKMDQSTSENSAYKVSRGSHGIGQKATNFLSSFFKVVTFTRDKWWMINYTDGTLTTELTTCKAPTHPHSGKPLTKGTYIHFKPNTKKFFTDNTFPTTLLKNWAQLAAYFTSGLKISLYRHSGEAASFSAPNGPLDYITAQRKELNCEPLFGDDSTISLSNEMVDLVFQYTNADGGNIRGFTNGLYNPDGGAHVDSFLQALKEVLYPLLKKGQDFTLNEMREGCIALVNAKMSAPTFNSQTKEKLTDPRAKAPLYEFFLKELTAYFKKNKSLAAELVERFVKLKELRTKFTSSKKLVTALRNTTKRGLPAKIVTAPDCKPEEREIFLIEGDSAAGTAKASRDKYYQEVFPLRGKILNVEKVGTKKGQDPDQKVFESVTILEILAACGFDPKNPNPLDSLRAGKLIFLSDPDPDGFHINSLLVTLFHKYLPEMFEKGMVYVAMAPEFFCIAKNGKTYYGSTRVEISNLIESEGTRGEIRHIKGWGEVNPAILKQLAFDPTSRSLAKIVPAEGKDGELKLLMGKSSEARKRLLGI